MNNHLVVEKTIPVVFPYVSFTNIEGKEFCIERSRLLHSETYCYKDEYGQDKLDHSKTFVNFESPNCKSKGSLHTIVDMPLSTFRNTIICPAYGGDK